MKYKIYLVVLGLFVSIQLFGNNIVIKGTIIDSATKKPISNVNISIKGSYIGTITNNFGYFYLSIDTLNLKTNIITINHVKYKTKEIEFNKFKNNSKIKLIEKIFQFKNINYYGEQNQYEYKQELRNVITTISSATFEDIGNVDVSDILKNEQSIHIDEKLNGEKNISVRGSNSDEVLILYDGIPINNNFNNNSDLSLINEDILDHIDVVRGNNVASIGAHNSSAVINFIPKYKHDYLIKFGQQIGSYNSGKWNVNVYKNIFGINSFVSFSDASSQLNYIDTINTSILNTSSNLTIGSSFPFGKNIDDEKKHKIDVNYLQNNRNYGNDHIFDTLETNQTYMNFRFTENFTKLGKSSFYFSNQNADQSHNWIYNDSTRKRIIEDDTKIYQYDHTYKTDNLDFYFGYQKKYSDVLENYRDIISDFQRNENKISTGIQFKNTELSYPFDLHSVQFNIVYENVSDSKIDIPNIQLLSDSINTAWSEKSYMISTSFIATPINYHYKVNFNYSSGFKIPSLYQQITSIRFPISENGNSLLTEYKSNIEMVNTLSINKLNSNFISEILLTFSVFTNSYTNKMRMIRLKGSTVQYYDNYSDANIFGIESSITPFFSNGIFKFNLSISRYFIDDKMAFPFKPTKKIISGLTINYKSLHFNMQFFQESGSIGLVVNEINNDGILKIENMELGSFEGLDIQFKKNFNIWKVKTYISISGKNILDDQVIFEGIAIKDRRFYLSGGIKI